ncbi:hypothetical protein [Amycolatopsis regifaucium]|uniref:Uncharacterized protein n=1 Tax=Amycolatopsis regifaucium TaxID=546365 RepID=A0A154MNG0_9PSEU|nr:hypothetical protein [Amycolatopsis regifaucium]KZB85821.1 hypothetical protein AVL48_29680 [Amycolatopsis regifaucium]OKA10680.1 hypothetical protein ATP06_0204230 [Amycolatopsis regifaucium]
MTDIADRETLVIDCDRCAVRGDACHDCVVSVLLGAPPSLEWDADERKAVDALAEAGMIPRLRMVRRVERERRMTA